MKLVLVVHNIRSCHNVGSLLRSADGLGIDHVYLTGYTPYPSQPNDSRLPHIAQRMERQIDKTALGAQNSVAWSHNEDIQPVINDLRDQGYLIVALEQTPGAIPLNNFSDSRPVALIVGSETEGLTPDALSQTDLQVEIPMLGKKESFNVAVAASMALYHLRNKA